MACKFNWVEIQNEVGNAKRSQLLNECEFMLRTSHLSFFTHKKKNAAINLGMIAYVAKMFKIHV